MEERIFSSSQRYVVIGIIAVLGASVGIAYGLSRNSQNVVHYATSSDYRRSLSEFIDKADGIVLGTVKDVSYHKEKNPALGGEETIMTSTVIDVEEYVFNPNNETTGEITVKTTGGRIGNEELISDSSPQFSKGEQVIVIIGIDPNTKVYYVYGSAQGKYHVNDDGSIGSVNEMENIRETLGFEAGMVSIDDFKKKVIELQNL